jgi:L-2-hydroxyglutarate oxidase LhgO
MAKAEEEGLPGFINLLGIESPGLTSALAIGEMVNGILYNPGTPYPH